MNTIYKITRIIFGELKSFKLTVKELTVDVLKDSSTFSLTAFVSDDKSERDRLVKQMTELRDIVGWKSDVTYKPFDSETYGKGYAINVMKEFVEPKATEDDMNSFIASVKGSTQA